MSKRLKWLSLFVLVLVMIGLILASCGGSETESTTGTNDNEESSDTHEHVWGEWNITREPTCEKKGYRNRTCSECEKIEREELEPTGHVFGEWETVTENTCTDAGEKKRVCTVCEFCETEEIEAKGHSFGKPVQTAAPTCDEDGANKKVCKTCKYEEIEVIPATGHTYVDYVCSVCNTVTPEKAVQTVKIANTSLLLPLDTNVKLDVQVYPTDALYTSVTYTIDERNNSCGATITEDGVLSCTKVGSVRVRVTRDTIHSPPSPSRTKIWRTCPRCVSSS